MLYSGIRRNFADCRIPDNSGLVPLSNFRIFSMHISKVLILESIPFLSGLRMVQPGRLVSSAQKYAWRKRRVGADQSGNLGKVASVITGRRAYNLEFTDYSDLKAFHSMIEAVFAVTLLTS